MNGQFAPPWLPRQRRRHVDRALRKLIHRNACSICGKPFESGSPTAPGFDASGAVALAGQCCIGKLTEIFGVGFDVPLPAGATSELADIRRRSGVDGMLQVNPSDGPWKDDDRIWFEQNPARSHRMRAPLPGEYDAAQCGHVLIVLVRQVAPGCRMRPRLCLGNDLLPVPDSEAAAHALFEVAVRREPLPPDREGLIALIEKYSVHTGVGS